MNNIPLQGLKNTRDLGGTAVRDGRVVRPRVIIRGAAPAAITDGDAVILTRDFDLKTLIDLRTDAEVAERPDRVPDGVDLIRVPLFADEVIGITRDKKSEAESASGFRVPGPPDMKTLYRFLVEGDIPVAGLRRVFRIIFDTAASNRGSVLFHCSVGKDRTGVVAMLALGILGADEQTIVDDYLYTNVTGEADAQKYYDIAFAATGGDLDLSERTRRAFLAVEDYLRGALDAVAGFGGFDAYFTRVLGFGRGDVDDFRRNMLVDRAM